ncbi:MAG TPA: tripartite tricarboxylate transporter substrate binding protein [Bordetella sp.]|jgi:tripartite-type tricarboxylate transporter receptor subunit TctC|nr:tripartite tricarboxylate transporter substrate binding protein [Bordetella sp.]
MSWSRRHVTLAGAAFLLGLHRLARAADDSPVRMVVGFTPGGSIDAIARVVAQKITTLGDRPYIIDNRSGAAGNIATQEVMNAPADGKTVLVASLPFIVNPYLYQKAGYDAAKDFDPVVLIARSPMVLVVRADSPWHTVQEFVAAAKAKPGTLNYSSAGIGSNLHVAAALFCEQAGITAVHIPYRGGGQVATALMAGEVQFCFGNALVVDPFVASGKLRALAVTGLRRNPELPQVPTLAESALPGYEFSTWWGLLVAKGTDSALVAGLNHLVNMALQTPDLRAQLAKQGGDVVGGDPGQLASAIRDDSEKLGRLIRERGLKGA